MRPGVTFILSFVFALGILRVGVDQMGLQSGLMPEATAAVARSNASAISAIEQETRRAQLLETLDGLVVYQHYYRSMYGHFTRMLKRVGYSLPNEVLGAYDVRVEEASGERVRIVAFAETEGRIGDQVSIDQNFVVQANFPLPSPRPEYLESLALRHLRQIKEGRSFPKKELSFYQGYFQYQPGPDLEYRAIGVKAPVIGRNVQLNLNPSQGVLSRDLKTGQTSSKDLTSTLEEAYLAQRIFRGENGRYAESWDELAKITDFRFDEQDSASEVPFSASVDEGDLGQGRSPAGGGLLIEKIETGSSSKL